MMHLYAPDTHAYNLRPGLAPAVLAGSKRQTYVHLQKGDRRPAPGESAMLYVPLDGDKVRILREVTIADVEDLHIDLTHQDPIWIAGQPLRRQDREQFARDEGFNTYLQLQHFLFDMHGHKPIIGVLVKWEVEA